jgi:hypothetical protein
MMLINQMCELMKNVKNDMRLDDVMMINKS